MAISVFLTAGSVSTNDGTTFYYPVCGFLNSFASVQANEATPVREAGTFSNLFVRNSVNDVSSNSTVTVVISAVNSALTITYSSLQTGVKEDTTHTASVGATDTVSYSSTIPNVAGTHAITWNIMGMQFNPTTTTNCVQFLSNSTILGAGVSLASTAYLMPVGWFVVFGLNTDAYTCVSSFTSSNFYTNVNSNSGTVSTTIGTMKNGSAANQSVVYLITQTGIKEDTTHTDSLVSGDTFGYEVTEISGSGTIGMLNASSRYVNTSSQFPLQTSIRGAALINFNVTCYWPMYSVGNDANVTNETLVQYYPETSFTTSLLEAQVDTNTIATSNTTIKLRKGTANANQSLTYAAAQTGVIQDTTNSDSIGAGAGNEIDYQIITPNTSGSFELDYIAILGSTAVNSTISVQPPQLIFF